MTPRGTRVLENARLPVPAVAIWLQSRRSAQADAIEIVIGQGAKPAAAACCWGRRSIRAWRRCARCPPGVDQRSASGIPTGPGRTTSSIKINELREITDWEKPIYVKVGATRVYHDVKLAIHAGADVIVVDGMQGGTAATQTVFIEHVGIPTLAAVRQAVEAIEDMNMRGKVQLIISGGIRTGADVAKALAMGADAVAIGQGVLMALGCNSESYVVGGQHVSTRRRLREARHRAGFLPSLPYRALPGGRDHAGCGPRAAAGAGGGREAADELSEDAEHGTHDASRAPAASRTCITWSAKTSWR